MHSFRETHTRIAISVSPSFSKTFGSAFICLLDHCTQLSVRRVLGFFGGCKKRLGLEFGHSPPYNNEWSYTSTSPYAFLVWTGTIQPSAFHDDILIYSTFSLFNFRQSLISKWLKDKHVNWAWIQPEHSLRHTGLQGGRDAVCSGRHVWNKLSEESEASIFFG